MQDVWDAIEKIMIDCEMATPDTIEACDDDDIADIEDTYQLKLPLAYKQFLLRFGRQAGMLLHGSTIFYPDIMDNRRIADDIAEEDGFELKPSCFVFIEHHGYQFLYFDTTVGDDPPVFRVIEGVEHCQVSESFSKWMTTCVQAEAGLFENNKETKARVIDD